MKLRFRMRLWIGRLQRCPKCDGIILNRKGSLYHDLYTEKYEGQPKKRSTWCDKCSESMRF